MKLFFLYYNNNLKKSIFVQLAEEAKRISEEVKNEADSSGAAQDSFVERLVRNQL